MSTATFNRIENTYGEFVANVYANYGANLTLGIASSIARQHSTNLAELAEEGLTIRNESVKTLNLFDVLGY